MGFLYPGFSLFSYKGKNMNKIFKIVFNAARGKMMVVNEATSSVQTGKKAAVTVAVVAALGAGVAQAASYDFTFDSATTQDAVDAKVEASNGIWRGGSIGIVGNAEMTIKSSGTGFSTVEGPEGSVTFEADQGYGLDAAFITSSTYGTVPQVITAKNVKFLNEKEQKYGLYGTTGGDLTVNAEKVNITAPEHAVSLHDGSVVKFNNVAEFTATATTKNALRVVGGSSLAIAAVDGAKIVVKGGAKGDGINVYDNASSLTINNPNGTNEISSVLNKGNLTILGETTVNNNFDNQATFTGTSLTVNGGFKNSSSAEVGKMNVGTLIVHGNALNADNSTLNATNIAVDEALKNETGAGINVTNGSITARTIDGAEGNITVTGSTVAVAEASNFGNVTADNSSVSVGTGDYTFNTFAGEGKSIVVNDLSANVSIATKEGALDLIATGTANDNYGTAQESVERIQEVLKYDESKVGDVYLLSQGVVNDGARIEFNEQGEPVITYMRNTNMEDFGSLAALSIVNWRNELNSLSKRMGELRDSPAGIGTWVRLYGSENELGSITARNTTVQIGSDYSIGDWKVGVAVNYTDGDADFAAGSGDNKNYGVALYGTWLSESGQFVDLMAKYSRLDQDFQLSGMDGSYDNNAYALSVEYGWRFELGSVAFVEPQAAFTYSHIEGDSFQASGAEVEQDNYDSYIGRVGVRSGFKFPDNKGNIYARVSYLYDFDGEMNATARAVGGHGQNYIYEDLGGSWVEYGVGANFNLTDRTYTYVDLERNSGGEIKENWRWNVGLRHVF